MYQLAVFDMAGTTVDDRDEVYRVLRASAEREGARFSDATFQEWMGTEKRHAITNLLRIGGVAADDARVDKAYAWFIQELKDTYTKNPPTPLAGVEDAFASLRERGVSIALTTGFSREIVDVILAGMGWDHEGYIDTVVAGDEVAAGRPAPDMILTAMRRLGITDTGAVISAGDTAVDVRSANNAHVTSVGVLTGHLTEDDFRAEHADLILPGVADLPAALAERS